MTDVRIAWLRRDLRVDDNPVLERAAQGDQMLAIYCESNERGSHREYGGSESFQYRRRDTHREAFLANCLAALDARLRDKGGELLVLEGSPPEVIPDVVEEVGATSVHHQVLPTPEERSRARAVRQRSPCDVDELWSHTLYRPSDLPFPLSKAPSRYTPFANLVRQTDAPSAHDAVESVPQSPSEGLSSVSPLELREEAESATLSEFSADGGEKDARKRLEQYVSDGLATYKWTRNQLGGEDFSSKLSAWLSMGCLSPRRVRDAVDESDASGESVEKFVDELLWREFFQVQAAKYGGELFEIDGGKDGSRDGDDEEEPFGRWRRGVTGVPIVDAAVRELNQTGWMSNRARLIAASYLVHDLGVDWRRGAAHFERMLVDYDPASNYGNWAYVSGSAFRSGGMRLDVVEQSEKYDESAAYIKEWCPELDKLPAQYAHRPWKLSEGTAKMYGVDVGEDYPEPTVRP